MPLPRNVKTLMALGSKPMGDGKENKVVGWADYNGQLFSHKQKWSLYKHF